MLCRPCFYHNDVEGKVQNSRHVPCAANLEQMSICTALSIDAAAKKRSFLKHPFPSVLSINAVRTTNLVSTTTPHWSLPQRGGGHNWTLYRMHICMQQRTNYDTLMKPERLKRCSSCCVVIRPMTLQSKLFNTATIFLKYVVNQRSQLEPAKIQIIIIGLEDLRCSYNRRVLLAKTNWLHP